LSRRKILAIVGAIAIATGAIATWQILRPRSIGEVFSMEGLRAGSEIDVQGTITGIGRENTSYGPRAYLRLDGNTLCGGSAPWSAHLRADPNGSYAVGESYRTTLHFQAFSIDGDAAVWAPELACPFPVLHRSIAFVLDAAAGVGHMRLEYNRTDSVGWSRYDFQTGNSTGFDPNILPVDLLKALPFWEAVKGSPIDSVNEWREWSDVFYVMNTAALGPQNPGYSLADQMISLAAPVSTNGTLRFVDADSNGLVNSGDGLDVRFPPTASSNEWDSYLIRIGNFSFGPSNGSGVHLTLIGPAGPFEALAGEAGVSVVLLRESEWNLRPSDDIDTLSVKPADMHLDATGFHTADDGTATSRPTQSL